MKIEVKYEASYTTKYETFDTKEQFGLTDDEWNELSEDEKNSLLMEAVENNQPYWMVERVTNLD